MARLFKELIDNLSLFNILINCYIINYITYLEKVTQKSS